MKKKIKNINGWNIIWLLIYLMPFLLSIGYIIVIGNALEPNLISNDTIFNYYLTDYFTFLNRCLGGNIGYNGFLYLAYRNLLSYFFNAFTDVNYSGLYYYLIPLVLQYISLVSIVRIGVDVILMLPNIVHNFIDKIGGERE